MAGVVATMRQPALGLAGFCFHRIVCSRAASTTPLHGRVPRYPAAPALEEDPSLVVAPGYGIVTKLPHHVLVDMAEKADCVLE